MVLLVASASLAEAVITDGGPDHGVLVDGVGRRVDVGDSTHVEFVHVADRDRERACRRGGVGGGGSDGDVVGPRRLAIDAAGHGDHARVAVDREAAARVVVQRVADRIAAVRHRRRRR